MLSSWLLSPSRMKSGRTSKSVPKQHRRIYFRLFWLATHVWWVIDREPFQEQYWKEFSFFFEKNKNWFWSCFSSIESFHKYYHRFNHYLGLSTKEVIIQPPLRILYKRRALWELAHRGSEIWVLILTIFSMLDTYVFRYSEVRKSRTIRSKLMIADHPRVDRFRLQSIELWDFCTPDVSQKVYFDRSLPLRGPCFDYYGQEMINATLTFMQTNLLMK